MTGLWCNDCEVAVINIHEAKKHIDANHDTEDI